MKPVNEQIIWPYTRATKLALFSILSFFPLQLLATELDQQIKQVEKLIQYSVGSKEIVKNGDSKAHLLKQQAKDHLQQARQAQAANDEKRAREELNKAKMAIFKSMKKVGGRVKKDKQNLDYQRHLDSLKALLEAHKRISQEKNSSDEDIQLQQHVSERMNEASALYKHKKLASAIDIIQQAYLSVRLAIARLRDGDTLVRTLEFSSKEEEYQYELQRNDTLKLMIGMLLKEKLNNKRFAMMINIPLKQAESLRKQAKQQAASQQFEEAIKTLEQSTKQIIRTIRAAGIYIPG